MIKNEIRIHKELIQENPFGFLTCNLLLIFCFFGVLGFWGFLIVPTLWFTLISLIGTAVLKMKGNAR